MKIVAINSLPSGSPAQIMNEVLLLSKDFLPESECFSFYPFWRKKHSSKYDFCNSYGGYLESRLSAFLSIFTGIHNSWFVKGTRELLSRLNNIKPDIIHLHNLHIWTINIKMLFDYINKNNVKVVWTLHDCWPFTGHCTYFSMLRCDKWKTTCKKCPKIHRYPYSIFDRSKKMFYLKKNLFTSVEKMCIVTPSLWLKSLVEESFLNKYPVICINNGIDLTIFKPRESNFRTKYNLRDKIIILGVSLEWGTRKGLDVFNSISGLIPENYAIVLVGVDCNLRKKVNKQILCIEKTTNQVDLAEIYSAADVFFNPTREDNFPTVNIESLACGTPVVTFNNGGSGEILDERCGIVLNSEDPVQILEAIERIVRSEDAYLVNDCLRRASLFDAKLKFLEYLSLYKKEL